MEYTQHIEEAFDYISKCSIYFSLRKQLGEKMKNTKCWNPNLILVFLVIVGILSVANGTFARTSVLFIAAEPSDQVSTLVSHEMGAIQNAITNGALRDSIKLEIYPAATSSILHQGLLANSPNIVHFSGHGSNSGEIVLLNSSGRSQVLSTDALNYLFANQKNRIDCVILNSCYSDKQAEVISNHIQYIVGIKTPISNEQSIWFSTGFYMALASGRSIEESFQAGKTQMVLEGVGADFVDANLVLRHHEEVSHADGKILSPQEGEAVAHFMMVSGTVENLPPSFGLHLAIGTGTLMWPKAAPEINADGMKSYSGPWSTSFIEPNPGPKKLILLSVSASGQRFIDEWQARGDQTGQYPGLTTIPGAKVLHQINVIVQ